MPAPEARAGGISLSKKGLIFGGKKGGASDQVMANRIREELETRSHAEPAVHPRQMCPHRDRRDFEVSSDVLIAQPFFEKLQSRDLGRRQQLYRSLGIHRR